MLSLVASYDGDDDNVGFTIDAYASIPISWIKETTALPYNEKVRTLNQTIHIEPV